MGVCKSEKIPKCAPCRFPENDDPQRLMIRVDANRETYLIKRCPNIETPFGKGCEKGRLIGKEEG